MNDHLRGTLALLIAALLWSTGGLLIKSIPLSALAIAGLRSAIAAVVILAYVRRPQFTWSRAQWGASISYMLTVLLFVSATKLTTAANAILLQYTAPVWVALFSAIVTKEKLTRLDIISVITVCIGMAVFFIDSVSAGGMTGNIIAVLSGMAFAGVALSMRAQHGASTRESILLGNVLTAVVCLPFMESFSPTTDTVVRILLLGVLQLGVSYILYSWALAHVRAIEAVLITMIEPLLNPVWVIIGMGEVPTWTTAVGGAIVIGVVAVRGILFARRLRTT
jgi:drug/metabolite transporter (DMT)-like permease